MIRTAAAGGPDRVPEAEQRVPQPDQPGTSLRPAVPLVHDAGPAAIPGHRASPVPSGMHGPLPVARSVARVRGPGQDGPDHADQPGQAGGPVRNAPGQADQLDRVGSPGPVNAGGPVSDIDAAAVAAYRASVREGRPLSERKLAEAFGRTSRRWARNRMAEARQARCRPEPAHEV